VWLRGAAAALAGGAARGMDEWEALEGADTVDDYYEVGWVSVGEAVHGGWG
jgi:hypothetical protein